MLPISPAHSHITAMTYQARDLGHGMLYTFNSKGDVVACHTIISYCTGCGEPLISEKNRHDGTSGSGRTSGFELVNQWERDRIERVRFEIRGVWKASDGWRAGLRRDG